MIETKNNIVGSIKPKLNIAGKINKTIEYISPNNQKKSVIPTKEIQEITPDEKYNGLSKVIVDKIPDEYIIPKGEINITENGEVNVADKETAIVNVPEKKLGNKIIIKNGTYKATDDNLDGYSQVEVETSGVDINDYFDLTKKTSGSVVSYIKTIPKLDTSGYTSFSSFFSGFSNMETIPLLNTGNATNLYDMFYNCSSLKTIPLIDTSKVTRTEGMFSNCSSLKTIPLLNTSKVTNAGSMFYRCSSLTNIPLIDTSKVTNAALMFGYCSSLKTIPLIDTSNVTNMSSTFTGCSKLEEIPLLDTSNVTEVFNMFHSCYDLITIPQLDTSNIKNMGGMFNQCISLTTVPLLNCSSVTKISEIFLSCYKLENLGGFYNLGNNYPTNIHENDFEKSLNLSFCPKLTHDSLMNVINNLYDIASKRIKTQQLVLGSTNLAKLTAEEIAIATEKGWTVS